jgi:hypothetical protein
MVLIKITLQVPFAGLDFYRNEERKRNLTGI